MGCKFVVGGPSWRKHFHHAHLNVETRPGIKVEKSEKKVTKPEGDVFEFAGLTALGSRQSAPSAVMLSSYPKPVFNASSIRCRAAERTQTERNECLW